MFYKILSKSAFFKGIADAEIPNILEYLAANSRIFKKDEIIVLAGDKAEQLGIIISGNAHLIKEDFFGNRTIMTTLNPTDSFGEAFVFAENSIFLVSVIAATECEILFLDYSRVISVCSSSCKFHNKLIENMLMILANKNIILNQKVEVMSRRTTRQKLLHYLSVCALNAQKNEFTIPYNRQELADFLGVDRSAMSSEIGKLLREKVLKTNKNHFILYQEKVEELI